MARLVSILIGLALISATTGCGTLSRPPTQREQTAGIGALAGGATGAIIGSFAGSAVAGGLFGIPLGALAGYYIGDRMNRDDLRREAEKRESDRAVAELRNENERLRRQVAEREEEKAGTALVSADRPAEPAKPHEISMKDLPGKPMTIGFEFDKSTLNGTSHQTLRPIVAWLKGGSERGASIVGYTDSVGAQPYNVKLSERRARAVQQYLIQNGVAAGKISARGMGKANPVSANDTAAGREKNRRVEVILNGNVNTASAH
jgi:outer membrane protein OmpA-like peptidoglycan-associated protein